MALPQMPTLPTQGAAGQMRAPINPMMQRQQAPMGIPPMPPTGGGMPQGLPSQAMGRPPMMPSTMGAPAGGGMMPQLPPQAMQAMAQRGLFGGNATPPGMQQALNNPQLMQLLARFGMMGGGQPQG